MRATSGCRRIANLQWFLQHSSSSKVCKLFCEETVPIFSLDSFCKTSMYQLHASKIEPSALWSNQINWHLMFDAHGSYLDACDSVFIFVMPTYMSISLLVFSSFHAVWHLMPSLEILLSNNQNNLDVLNLLLQEIFPH